jgi:gamma-glutamyltranspeptidase/glutathione hydrolase
VIESGINAASEPPTLRLIVSLCFALLLIVPAHAATEAPRAGRFSLQDAWSPVVGTRGMVVTEEELASEIGAEILARGGNAVDASVAVGFALAVVLPEAGNLGGGGFMLLHLAQERRTVAVDYREVAPLAAPRGMFLKPDGSVDHDELDHGAKGIAVPGTVAGLAHVLERYGTMKWWQVLDPAIALADKGFTLNASQVASLEYARERLLLNEEAARVYLGSEGAVPALGTRRRYPDLAASLKALKRDGASALYGGKLGERVVADVQRLGGVLSLEDLRSYRVVEREPVRGSYRGHEIVSMPPPSSGGVHLVQMLNILEGFPLGELGVNSAAGVHLMSEAMRRAYADRSHYLADPDFVPVPVAALTSKDYAAALRAGIDPQRATRSQDVRPGKLPPPESKQTTHYSVMDRHGNAVACTVTLNWSYGSGIVARGTGILLNNEMDDFAAKPGEPNIYGLTGGEANAVEPRKRPLSSMTPTFVMRGGQVFLMTGSPGGAQIITTVLQTIVDVIDHDLNVATAANLPRFHHQWLPDQLLVERLFSPDTVAALRARGHTVETTDPIGTTQSILYWDGLFQGAADPRRGGGRAIAP